MRELLLLATAMAVGLGLATLPHWWAGESDWVGDYDELAFYAPLGAAAYRDHPYRLTDPTTGGPTYYQALPTVPGVLIAKALDLGPWRLGLCWRSLAGLAVGAGWYLLFRTRFGPVGALAAACILLSDPGVVYGQIGFAQFKSILQPIPLERATTPSAGALAQWRILNPALSWPWWLAFAALMSRAIATPTRRRIVAAGIAFGLLFHIYFYLWTAAAGGLILAVSADRRRCKVYLGVLALGAILGAPALISSAEFRAEHGSDWLRRTDKFLSVGRFEELLVPKISLVLLLIAWIWVLRRGRESVWLVATATAGLLLLNQTALTGLQIENFHWNFALGPTLSALTVLMIADSYGRLPTGWARRGPLVAIGCAVASVGAGARLEIRTCEGLPENTRIRAAVAAFRRETAGIELPSGAVAGDPDFQYTAAIGFDVRPLAGYTAVLSPIPDRELDARIALNGYLLGRGEERFRADQRAALATTKWGPEARSAEAQDTRLAARSEAWNSIAADPVAAVARFDVRVLARPSDDSAPPPAGFTFLRRGPRWSIWIRP